MLMLSARVAGRDCTVKFVIPKSMKDQLETLEHADDCERLSSAELSAPVRTALLVQRRKSPLKAPSIFDLARCKETGRRARKATADLQTGKGRCSTLKKAMARLARQGETDFGSGSLFGLYGARLREHRKH